MDPVLLSRWNLDPSLVLGIAGLGIMYVGMLRVVPLSGGGSRGWGEIVTFIAALLLLVVALMSPLDYLSDHVLFTAHMLQHLVLLLVVPPLLLVGLPERSLAAIGRGLVERLGGLAWVAQPLPALLLSTAVVWVWHVPIFYEAALHDEAIHVGEHLSFVATALAYWWPFARPSTYPWAFPELLQLGSLLAALFASSILGAALTFAAPVLYPTYATASPAFAALGVTPLVDQQLGGLMMWVGGGLWYVVAAGVVLARWFARPIEDDDQLGRHLPDPAGSGDGGRRAEARVSG